MASKTKLESMKFGRLFVIDYAGGSRWNCVCDCGVKTIAWTRNLKNGNTQSCGCLHKEAASMARKTHGQSGKPLYQIWSTMKSRCYNETNSNYSNYGGRGIKVCERWLHSFENFSDDMGESPSPNHSIDREDNDGDYEPDNCRWATAEEQCSNRRNSILITHKEKTQTLAQWARELGINAATLKRRIVTLRMPLSEALTGHVPKNKIRDLDITEVAKRFDNPNRLTGLKEVANELGVNHCSLRIYLQEHFAEDVA